MTNTLLIIIAALLAVRIVLLLWQGKRAFEKMYCAPSEVESHCEFCDIDVFAINEKLHNLSKDRWELTAIERVRTLHGDCFALFFTRKKIKNFLEE